MARYHFLKENGPSYCPNCKIGDEYEVTDWSISPGHYRCKLCKHRFKFEPLDL